MGSGNPDAYILDPEPAPPVFVERELRRRTRLSCVNCGAPFDRTHDRLTYCTACVPDRGKPLLGPRHCAHCKEEFVPADDRRQYCSMRCADLAQLAEYFEVGCPVCGKPKAKRKNAVYCSKRCKHVAIQRRSRRVRYPI